MCAGENGSEKQFASYGTAAAIAAARAAGTVLVIAQVAETQRFEAVVEVLAVVEVPVVVEVVHRE